MRKIVQISRITYLIMVIFFVGCNNQPKQNTSNQQKSNKIKVGYLPMVSSLTHFVAVERGFYTDQGLDVEAVEIKTSNLIAQELSTGHINIGVELALTPLLKQNELAENSITIFSTSNITIENGFDAILIKSDSKIKTLNQLSGKRVGGFPGSTAKVSFLDLFNKLYPQLEPPKFIELSPNLHIQSLENSEIDGLFAYEPVLTTGKVRYKFIQIFPSIYGTQFSPNPIGVAGVNTAWYKSNQDLAHKYFIAIDDAIDFIKKNPIDAKNILAKATNIDIDIAQNMNILPLSKSNEIDLDNLDKYMTVLLELKEINKISKACDICIKQNRE